MLSKLRTAMVFLPLILSENRFHKLRLDKIATSDFASSREYYWLSTTLQLAFTIAMGSQAGHNSSLDIIVVYERIG